MARAEYETPEVQVYVRGTRLLACLRATGRERVVGVRDNDGMGTDESTYVSERARRALGLDESCRLLRGVRRRREDTLTDLRTGKRVEARVDDEDLRRQAVARARRARVDDRRRRHRALHGRAQVQTLSADPAATALARRRRARVLADRRRAAHRRARAAGERSGARARRSRGRSGVQAAVKGARLLLRKRHGCVITRAGGEVWALLAGPRRGGSAT